MAFVLIKGNFTPTLGIPDGDSVRFRAKNKRLWNRLEGRPVKFGTGATTKNTVQLRFEGIDAIEKAAIQPLAAQAKDSMLKLIGFQAGTNETPEGFVLARMTDDTSGRPIAFVIAGKTTEKDGAEIFLDPPLLRKSVNFRQLEAGHAYPLYYNTLFAKLRTTLNTAHATAVGKKRGVWPTDATKKGVAVNNADDLETIPPIWPKLWRRLQEFERTHDGLTGFIDFLAAKNERIDVLDIMEERGLQDLVSVSGDKVKLLEPPQNLRVVGDAGHSPR